MSLFEANFDGLVGWTHNYAGLAFGNVASEINAGAVSSPRAAALQGLEKMRALHDLGIRQAVMPPHPRPYLAWLRGIGFSGSDQAVIENAYAYRPHMLALACSSSAMWTANAATVTPSSESGDGKLHLSPANLATTTHRALEWPFTYRLLSAVFAERSYFSVHPPLPPQALFADEGAANHMRLSHSGKALHIFVYGRSAGEKTAPARYPARQTREAFEAVARRHGIHAEQCVFLQQHPVAIDAGVFHNDVIATSNGNVLLYHESAYVDEAPLHNALREHTAPWYVRRIAAQELSLPDAVKTYFFNSQIVDVPEGGMIWIAPVECEENAHAKRLIEDICADNNSPIHGVRYMNLRESMRNGGGPACLRMRVQLTEEEWNAVHPGVRFTPELHDTLILWVKSHYREQLRAEDLRDPELLRESARAQASLEVILDLPGLYAE